MSRGFKLAHTAVGLTATVFAVSVMWDGDGRPDGKWIGWWVFSAATITMAVIRKRRESRV